MDYTSRFNNEVPKMKVKDIVKFTTSADEVERNSLMSKIEKRGDRVLVRDFRFMNWGVPPTDVYAMSDLEVATEAVEVK